MLNGEQVLDRYYPEVRAWLIQIAAVMDRYERGAEEAGGVAGDDVRLRRLRESLAVVGETGKDDRAKRIQMIFSDPYEGKGG